MDVKQIIERGKNVSKAMSDDEPASSFLKILGDLRNVRATEDLLRQTKIGVTINRLRTYKYPEVAKLSQELITKWKNEVNNAKKKANTQGKVAGSGTPNSAAAVGSSAPPSGTASPAPQAAGKKTHSVDPASRNDKTDKVNTTIFGIPARDNCIKLMYNGLAFMSEERKYSRQILTPCVL
jgi:transcription elongation factor S-II